MELSTWYVATSQRDPQKHLLIKASHHASAFAQVLKYKPEFDPRPIEPWREFASRKGLDPYSVLLHRLGNDPDVLPYGYIHHPVII